MHRLALIALAACTLTVACGDDNPTAPSNAPLVFSAVLRPANENPPVGNAESGGVGAAQVTMQVTRDAAGAITGATADFYFQATNFPGGTTVVGAHIHTGIASVNGPVIIGTSLSATAPFRLDGGTGEFRQSGVVVSAANAQGVIANPSAFYFNIHSPLNPGGFARGQLSRVQ